LNVHDLSRQQLQQRKYIFSAIVFVLFLFLFYGFFNIQIAGADKYYEIAFDNSVRPLTQYPPRGTIRDAYGQILVDNRPSFFVSIIPRQVTGETLELLSDILHEDLNFIKEKIRGRFTFRPVIVKKDVDYQTVAVLEERRLDLPGVLIQVESKRYYPENVSSPHIFGYVGEVTAEEAARRKDFYPGELIGKSGLELKYDTNLRGVKGVNFVRVDAEGRDLGLISAERNIRAIPGMDLYLTLDYSFQQFAESLMVDKRGAIIALDPRNGGVLLFVSKPDYDPRLLTGKISEDVWQNLQGDTLHPLYNRIIQSKYPPGSTYKLVAAIAALEENIITPKWKAYCPGYFRLGRKTISCWRTGGHGEISLMEAIKSSCNVYFYQLGLKIGLETWAEYSSKFFFGRPTGIDLPNESSGLVPTVSWFNERFGKDGWTKGVLANLAIGQGELLTTPLQMAQFAMIMATGGVVHTPHLAHYLYDRNSGRRTYFPTETNYVQGVSDEVIGMIRQGMRNVIDGGTGWLAAVPGIEVAGKTGTAQNPHGEDHAWFICFAPYEDPVIAMAVIIENGGGGGAVAAPLARMCLEKFFYNRILPRAIPISDTLNQDSMESIQPTDPGNIRPIEVDITEMN
jgi:penicillin-binding protein 2